MPGSRVSPAPGSSRVGPRTPIEPVAPLTPPNRPAVQLLPAPINVSSMDTLKGLPLVSKVTRTDWPRVLPKEAEAPAPAADSGAAAESPAAKLPSQRPAPAAAKPKTATAPSKPAARNGQATKPTRPAPEKPQPRSSVPVADDAVDDVEDHDDSDRLARRILLLGVTLFTAGLIVLLWWLFLSS
jgi:hypothetical protein